MERPIYIFLNVEAKKTFNINDESYQYLQAFVHCLRNVLDEFMKHQNAFKNMGMLRIEPVAAR